MSFSKRILYSTIVATGLISLMLSPALALDYEAKPVGNVIKAPIRAVGALGGIAACGLFSGPVDDGFHTAKKTTGKIAGAFGDENGKAEVLAAAPIGVPLGLVVGGVRGVFKGAAHGAKVGWEKPFSRYSFLTMEEEGSKK